MADDSGGSAWLPSALTVLHRPTYGIKYGSNFQPFVGKRDVKDRNDADLTQEPEVEVLSKALDDFGPMSGLPQTSGGDSQPTSQIMHIPAPLLCYWMGATEVSAEAE